MIKTREIWAGLVRALLVRRFLLIILVSLFYGLACCHPAFAQTYTAPAGTPPSIGVPGQGSVKPPVLTEPGSDGGTPGNVTVNGGPAGFGIPASLSVNPNQGGLNYSVPLDLPPGVAGMKPDISLQYNSLGGNGPLGVGWSIAGFSQIVRCPQTIATNGFAGGVNDDANDRFCLDGQQLIAIPSVSGSPACPDGSTPTQYAKEVDDLTEVVACGSNPASPVYWEVRPKSGWTYEFGLPLSEQTIPSSVQNTGFSTPQVPAANGQVSESWGLDKISDFVGNYIDLFWYLNQGVLYPAQVAYTGTFNSQVNVLPTNTVVFCWAGTGAPSATYCPTGGAPRTDAPVLYTAGTPHQTAWLLQSVVTEVSGSGVFQYVLEYQYGPSTQRNEITSINKVDSAGNWFEPLNFTWSDAQIDWQPDLITGIQNGLGASTTIEYMTATSPSEVAMGAASYPSVVSPSSVSVVSRILHNVPTAWFGPAGSPPSAFMSDTTTSYIIQYKYLSPVSDLQGRGYLGFGLTYVEDQQTGLDTGYKYWQGFPLIGQLASVDHNLIVIGTNNQPVITCYDCTTYYPAWVLSAQGTVFPYTSESAETRSDIGVPSSGIFDQPIITASLPTITTNYTYDTSGPSGSTWGNVTQILSNVTTNSNTGNFATTTTEAYAAPTVSPQLGLPSSVTVVGNSNGKVTNGRVTAFTYNYPFNQVTSVIQQPGGAANISSTTDYAYDNFGNVTLQTVSGADVSSVPNTSCPSLPVNVAPGLITCAKYDSQGQFPTSVTNAAGQTEHLSYDARFGGLTRVKDVNSQITNYAYDTFGRLSSKVQPNNENGSSLAGPETETYTYSITPSGSFNPIAVQDTLTGASGNASVLMAPTKTSNYDAIGRLIRSDVVAFDGSTSSTAYVYDQYGNLEEKTNPYSEGNVPVFYTNLNDELGRVYQTTNPDGSIDKTNYAGQTIKATNGLNQTLTVFKDGHGNTAWVRDNPIPPATIGNVISFTYNGFDENTSIVDSAGNTTTYVYDIRGRATKGVDPDKGAWTATYNSLGQLVGTSDANGNTATMSYDPLGRMSQRNEPDLTSNWTYDAAQYGVGELSSESDSGPASPSGQAGVTGFTKTYSYDPLGRLSQTSVSLSDPALALPISGSSAYNEYYAYDAYGRPLEVTDGADGVIDTYNGNTGYQTGVEQWSSSTSGAALWSIQSQNPAGLITSATYGSAITQNFTYDPNTERMTNVVANDNGVSAPLESVGYAYDVLGNVTSRTTLIPTFVAGSTPTGTTSLVEKYTYDGLNRLLKAKNTSNANYTETMTYDPLGDITSKTGLGSYTYPSAGSSGPHQVQSISGLGSFTYDADGNMLSGNNRSVTYTSFDMVKTATENGVTESYAYDPDHNRVTQSNSAIGGVELVYFDHANLAPAGNAWNYHFYIRNTNDERIGEIDRFGLGGGSTGTLSSEFYLNDWQNSVGVITDTSGDILELDSYDAWGANRYSSGAPETNPSASLSIYGYTNQEHDYNAELINLNARMYDPYVGVMLSVDPMVSNPIDQQTWNGYSYARDNPIVFTDPTGMHDAGACPTPGECFTVTARKPGSLGPTGLPEGGSDGPIGAPIQPKDVQAGNPLHIPGPPVGNGIEVPPGSGNWGPSTIVEPGGGGAAYAGTGGGQTLGYSADLGIGYKLPNDPPIVPLDTQMANVLVSVGLTVTSDGLSLALGAIVDRNILGSGGPLAAETAGALAPTGTNTVYQSFDSAGNVNYVGITNNFERRAGEQLSNGLSITPVPGLLGNLSRFDARSVEQSLINTYGLSRNGGSLLNQINSISPSNPIYSGALSRGSEILNSIGYGQ